MATEAQIEANRTNAQKSTGPRTAEGKARIGAAQRERWRKWRLAQSKVGV